jgi:predicted ATPase
VTIAQERGSVFHLAASRVVRGLASFEQEAESSLLEIREGLKALQAAGATLPWAVWSPSLAETCAKVGRVEESMAVLEEAFILIQKTGARLYEAELYRLKGELTLQSKTGLGQVEGKSQTSRSPSEVEQEAEACFLKAIQIAQKQQAKSLELRAATSLARVWQSQGKPHAARNMLADVYNWFTEGFDTKDLQEAKALLDELKQQ